MGNGLVAVITGGARGQGASHALTFARKGYTVYALDILEDAAAELLAQATSENVDVRFRRLDVTDEADWSAFAEHLRCEHGRVDVLVNNAGVVNIALIEDETLASFERVLRINLFGTFLGMKHTWALLRVPGKAAVVNIASSFAHVSGPGNVAYSASKSAVLGASRAAAIEGAELGIRVNTVSPGVVQTAMIEAEAEMLKSIGRNFTAGGTPLARRAQPQEISDLVFYLASDAAAFVTGSDFLIDGGYTAR